MKTGTFTDADAGNAFSKIARARLRNREIKPADLCLFAWIAAEAARLHVLPVQLTASAMQKGFDDGEEICPVGLSLNTIKTSLSRLEGEGFITIERTPSTKGELLTIDLQ